MLDGEEEREGGKEAGGEVGGERLGRGGGFGWEVKLTDRPYGDRLSPTGELLRSALTNAVGGDAGKVNSTKPFHGLPILFHSILDSPPLG